MHAPTTAATHAAGFWKPPPAPPSHRRMRHAYTQQRECSAAQQLCPMTHLWSDGGRLVVAHGDDDEQHLQVELRGAQDWTKARSCCAAVRAVGAAACCARGGEGCNSYYRFGHLEDGHGYSSCRGHGCRCPRLGGDSDAHSCRPSSVVFALQVELVDRAIAGKQGVLCRRSGYVVTFARGCHAYTQLACATMPVPSSEDYKYTGGALVGAERNKRVSRCNNCVVGQYLRMFEMVCQLVRLAGRRCR
jgi:hypothetical protein